MATSYCATCKGFPPRETQHRCRKCLVTRYCSLECQAADWEPHNEVCNYLGGQMPSPRYGLDEPIERPFMRLHDGTWLYNRPEEDVYRILIDAYRLRDADDFIAKGHARFDSIRGGATIGLRGFRRFLWWAGFRTGLLPPWWDARKRRECEAFGMAPDPSHFQDLRCPVECDDIVQYYRDVLFPLQLRHLAAAVYGCGVGGEDLRARRGIMADTEALLYKSGGLDTDAML